MTSEDIKHQLIIIEAGEGYKGVTVTGEALGGGGGGGLWGGGGGGEGRVLVGEEDEGGGEGVEAEGEGAGGGGGVRGQRKGMKISCQTVRWTCAAET